MNRILTGLLAILLLGGSAEAQVSVRRTPKKSVTNTETKTSTKKSTATTKTSAAKATSASSTSASAKSSNSNNSVVAKKTTDAKKNKQATSNVNLSGKTLRQQAFDAYQKDEATETPWQHIVYRELDLMTDGNASLYFPIEPQDGMTNLFRVIIEAFASGELSAYEYLDGREVFDEKYRVNPRDIFDKFQIYYQTKPATQRGGQELCVVEEADVPSSEVKSYYIKERWEFDQKHSKYQARILCICPVLHRSGDFGSDAVKYPMFWLNYEDLRPFLRDHMIVSQGMNTAARYTMEEFFTLQQYEGTIYKEQDLRGLTLSQQYPNADTLKLQQKALDEELRAFEDSIWVKEPVITEEKTGTHADSRKKAKKTEAVQDSTQVQPDATTAASFKIFGRKKNRRTKEDVDLEAAAEEQEAKATTKKSVRRAR